MKMRLINYRDRLLEELKDPEVAFLYFDQAANTGDRAAISLALQDIIEARGSLVVRLTKLRASQNPVEPPGNWGEFKLGQPTNTTSLPLDYTLTGVLLVPPRIGGKVKVLRTTRNGIEVPGVFGSTEVPVDFCQPGAIVRQRLTRKFLLSLPTGAYVVSNLYPNGRSAFAEQLGDGRNRMNSWNRAVAADAAQRLCQVVWTEEEFNKAAAGQF